MELNGNWFVSTTIHLDHLEASNEAIEELLDVKTDTEKLNLLPTDASPFRPLVRTENGIVKVKVKILWKWTEIITSYAKNFSNRFKHMDRPRYSGAAKNDSDKSKKKNIFVHHLHYTH